MKALVLEEYGQFTYRDWEEPTVGAGDVLVRVMACSVCGSDVHGMDGSTGRRIPPIIMGHEAAGVIEKLGEGVTDWAVGDRVTFDSTVFCGACENCAGGRINLCGNRRVLGVSCGDYRMHGAFAESVAVPTRILYRLPDNVDFVQASMIEPLAVAYHAVTRTQITPGCTCAVIGVGTIGALVVQVLKALGAGRVIAVDINEDKLRFAAAHGADEMVDSRAADAAQQILALTRDAEGVDIAVDATGISATMNLGLAVVKRGGSMLLVGNLAPTVDFPLQSVVTREISLFGSCSSAGEYPACLDLIAEGKVVVDDLISKLVPLQDGNEWIHRVKAGEKGLTKIVLIPAREGVPS